MDNRAKMTPHSRSALSAADTIGNVINSFSDQPFMQEGTPKPVPPELQDLSTRYPKYVVDLLARHME